jgi:hypothetical protein
MPHRPHNPVKIRIPLDDDALSGECVWASPLGGDRYRIENLPFFASDVGLHDVVLALEVDGMPELVEVVERTTLVRFLFELPPNVMRRCIDEVDRLELPCEGADGRVFVINLPDRSQARQAQDLLEQHAIWFERIDHEGAAVP